jgi:two-component system KDP operon response regulator KdpE
MVSGTLDCHHFCKALYLRVHIAHLREKIEANPSKPELIITESAVGYRLIPKS